LKPVSQHPIAGSWKKDKGLARPLLPVVITTGRLQRRPVATYFNFTTNGTVLFLSRFYHPEVIVATIW
jgi:hypothetical protein